MFVVDSSGFVRYLLGANIAQDPATHVELDPAWIYENTVVGDQDPVAFFHSHPRGEERPSPWDMSSFPHWYVSQCLIYALGGDPDVMIVYDHKTWVRSMFAAGIFVELVV
jgi:proteasome lid subunit RPN8/RPN11